MLRLSRPVIILYLWISYRNKRNSRMLHVKYIATAIHSYTYIIYNYDVERQRHNKQINYTQDN